MAWGDYDNAVDAGIGAGVRFNAATGRNYQAVYEHADGTPVAITGYISWEPHANRSNEGAFVRHDASGNVTGIDNFDPKNKSFRNFLVAVAGMSAAGLAIGAAGASATGGVTGAATGGSGAFLGEGVLSGVGSWDAAYTAALGGASTTATTVGSTLKSALSSAQTFFKPALSLASALTGGATGTTPQYVPFDQPATANSINPLVWIGLAIVAVYLFKEA